MKKMLKIKGLGDCECGMTAEVRRQPLIGGLVEFSTRMHAGFPHV
jgi:hypothetical protein